MKVSVSTWSYRDFLNEGMDLLEFLDEIKGLGAEAFEIHPRFLDEENPEKDIERMVKKAEKLNLGISSLIAANDFASQSLTERARQVEDMKKKINICSDLGINRMNVFTGYHRDGQNPVMETLRVIDCYREVAPLAKEENVKLCIENHSSVQSDADGILAIIKEVGNPIMRTNPDPTNFCKNHTQVDEKAKEVIYDETRKFAVLMENAHLKINTFDDDGMPDNVDFLRILDIYREVGYMGDIVLEKFGDEEPREAISKGIAYLKRVL